MTRSRPDVDDQVEFLIATTTAGVWELSIESDTFLLDDTCEELLGYEPGSFPGTYDAFLNCIVAEDREAVNRQFSTAIEMGDRFETEFRVDGPEADCVWVRIRGVVDESDGEATRLIGTQTNVTQERQRRRDLERHQQLFENTTDCVVEIERIDGDSLIRRVNAAFEDVFGYTEAEVRDEDIHDMLTPEECMDRAMDIRQSYLAGNQPVLEVTRNTANGQREFLMRAVNHYDRFYVIYTDITERKERERELEELNTRLELVLEETNTGIWEWNLETNEIRWDDTSERLFGYDPGAFPNDFDGFASRVPDTDLDVVREQVDRAIQNDEEYRAEFRVRPPDTDQRWLQSRGVVEYDDAGNPVRLRGIQTDITEHKQSEQALAQARERLRQIIDLIPDPLYVKNRDDEVVLSNVANAELHGLTREEIEGSREREVEADVENIENFDTYRQRELAVMETGEAMTFEEALTDPAGEDHVFRTTRIPFTAAGNDEDAVLGYARDVTPLKEYEQELEATKLDLEDTNRKLDQFAGIVSHDLRNPLSVILGYAEDMDVDDDTQSKVDAIRRSATRMEDMIEDLLVLSRLGQEIEDTETVSLRSVVEESWDNVRHSGSSLELDVPRSVTLDADRDRLLNVFENLFRNAAEHNEPPVTIHVGVIEGETDSDERPVAGFFVADDGTGIPDATGGDIFEHGYTTNRDGTGFGLSIVEAVVDAHDWRVSVSDSRNGGARFDIKTTSPE